MNGYEGMHMIGKKFLKEWQVTDKITESILSQFAFNQLVGFRKFTNGYNGKFTNGYKGMCMSWWKFSKPWQVTDKIIEWFFLQFIFYILQMTQTQEIINYRVLNIHKWIWGDVYDGGKFLKEWQVKDKITESIFSQISFNHLQMTQTQQLITRRVLKIHKWI